MWLLAMTESSLLISALLSVIHPELYTMGKDAMRVLPVSCNDFDVLELWCLVFNGAQVISNRETPVHRDNASRHSWYDILATVGPYHSAIFKLPGVGIRFAYPSGTVVGFCGRLLRHGVSKADGERICVAWYMRENVQNRLKATYAGWSHVDNVL